MNGKSFIFPLCMVVILAVLAILILPGQINFALAHAIGEDPSAAQSLSTPTQTVDPCRYINRPCVPTSTQYVPAPNLPPSATSTLYTLPNQPERTTVTMPATTAVQVFPGGALDSDGGAPSDGSAGSPPFDPLSPDTLPKIVAFGLLGLAFLLAILFGWLIFRPRRFGQPNLAGDQTHKGWAEVVDYGKVETMDKDHKGWAEVVDYGKVETMDKDHKGWSEVGDFPKVEQGGQDQFVKFDKGDQAGKAWSELDEFPKVEQGGQVDFPKVEQGGQVDFPKVEQGGQTDFPKVEQEGLNDFPKTEQDGLEDFPKVEGSGDETGKI